ncbi:MAG: molecular chaperone HtpG, partial [Alphaproteobacteria bacterium]|nr:molecular chaperone HtpG [Alphaproteobacteria bacterium]
KDSVKDVRVSKRLTDSPVCLVADEGDLDLNLERLLRQHKKLDAAVKRVLEVNPSHALIRGLASRVKAKGAERDTEDAALLLLDQALIMEGEPVADPVAFSRRLSALVAKGIAA